MTSSENSHCEHSCHTSPDASYLQSCSTSSIDSYKQALDSANTARALAAKAKLPFTRPSDYFAEMVKSDSHMERIRQKLLDERAGIAKAEDSRRQRELKKVGKQVQVEKLKERVKGKKEMDERLKGLKRSKHLFFKLYEAHIDLGGYSLDRTWRSWSRRRR